MRFTAGTVTGLLIGAVVLESWRTYRDRPQLITVATALGAGLLVEVVIGVVVGSGDSELLLLSLYAALATALWAPVIVLLVLAALQVPDSR